MFVRCSTDASQNIIFARANLQKCMKNVENVRVFSDNERWNFTYALHIIYTYIIYIKHGRRRTNFDEVTDHFTARPLCKLFHSNWTNFHQKFQTALKISKCYIKHRPLNWTNIHRFNYAIWLWKWSMPLFVLIEFYRKSLDTTLCKLFEMDDFCVGPLRFVFFGSEFLSRLSEFVLVGV